MALEWRASSGTPGHSIDGFSLRNCFPLALVPLCQCLLALIPRAQGNGEAALYKHPQRQTRKRRTPAAGARGSQEGQFDARCAVMLHRQRTQLGGGTFRWSTRTRRPSTLPASPSCAQVGKPGMTSLKMPTQLGPDMRCCVSGGKIGVLHGTRKEGKSGSLHHVNNDLY
ncbi:unnamed protein product [Ostreobium quekettii]|uniref:Uncharacterized protein n=1 Tax=Ostreobium quekettii TaxID=121088 RepID=A0A8S1J5M9_9CHLO|nr:unnamed protein product [Ostreobium quekettii]